MGLLARSLLARDAVAVLISIGILTILVGELYGLSVVLSGRTWLPGKVRKAMYILFLLPGAVPFGFLVSSWLSRFITSPGEDGFIQAILEIVPGAASFIIFVFLSLLMARWAFASPPQGAIPTSVRSGTRWIATYLPLAAFPFVGALLLALGIIILGIACWLVLV